MTQLTHNRILASLSFGFWVKLFYHKTYMMLGGDLLDIFHSIDNNRESRSMIIKKLMYIKSTRNRIAHCEPIIFINQRVNFEVFKKRIDNILELTTLLGVNPKIYDAQINELKILENQIADLIS